jgi:anti-sigma B factor antagonist
MASNRLNQVAALQLPPRFDAASSDWFSQQIESLDRAGCAMWVLDMAEVEFLDTRGLVGLVTARQAACDANVELVLCGLRRPIRMILDLAQLDRLFAIVESVEALPGKRLMHWVDESRSVVLPQAA